MKCHHRMLRKFAELPFYLRKHLHEDEMSCRLQDGEDRIETRGFMSAPVLYSTASDSSEFEGFKLEEEHEQIESSKKRRRRLVRENVVAEQSDEKVVEEQSNESVVIEQVGGKTLVDLPCTEVIPDRPLQSTMIEGGKGVKEILGVQLDISNAYLVLDQSVMVQEEVLETSDRIISELMSEVRDISDILNQGIWARSNQLSREGSNHSGQSSEYLDVDEGRDETLHGAVGEEGQEELKDSKEFSGFNMEERSGSVVTKLNEMRQLINVSRKNIMQGRTRSQGLWKDLMEYRDVKSFNISNNTTLQSNISRELGDYLTELSPQISSTPRRVLRSHGPVKEVPNVQSSVLEYKLKRFKL